MDVVGNSPTCDKEGETCMHHFVSWPWQSG
jgi:hypothetical protein